MAICGMNPLPTGRQAQPLAWEALDALGGVGVLGVTWALFPPAAGRLSHLPTGRQAHPP